MLFTKKYQFKIGSQFVLNFVRMLGRYGIRFEISNERYDVDEAQYAYDGLQTPRRHYYRIFNVYATKWQIAKLYDGSNVLMNYHMD